MRTLLMERQPEGTAIAVLDDRQLTDYRLVRETSLRAEAVVMGRVRQNVRGMAAAFVTLTGGEVGFLPEAEARQPLHPGDFVLVQVKKPASGMKRAYLTQDISLAGRGLILLPLTDRSGVSSRVSDEAERTRLFERAARLQPPGMGLILRRESLRMEDAALAEERDRLLARWRTLQAEAAHPSAPALLWPGRSALSQALDDFGAPDTLILDTVVVDAPPHEVRPHPFADFAVQEQRERLLRRQIWLPSGGFVVVDPCEALTAIDVNTGKAVGRNGTPEELFLRTNLEAADMIARVLRVRGVGGIVIVDLIDMASDEARRTVLDRFTALLQEDPVKCVVHGFTSLGLLEITRKRTGRADPQ